MLGVTTLTGKKGMTNHQVCPGLGGLLGPRTFSFKTLRVLAKRDELVTLEDVSLMPVHRKALSTVTGTLEVLKSH